MPSGEAASGGGGAAVGTAAGGAAAGPAAGGWQPVKSRGPILVDFRKEADKPTVSVRLRAELEGDLSMVKLAAILYEHELFPRWIPFCKRATQLAQPSRFQKLLHIQEGFPFIVPIANRDCVLHGIGVDMLEEDSAVIILRSVPEGAAGEALVRKLAGPDATVPPVARGQVRVDTLGGFYLRIKDGRTVSFHAIFNVDPKLAVIPSGIINFFCKNFAAHLVSLLKAQLKSYDSAGAYGPYVEARPEVYGVIKERMQSYMQRSGQPEEKSEQQQQQQQQQQESKQGQEQEQEQRQADEGKEETKGEVKEEEEQPQLQQQNYALPPSRQDSVAPAGAVAADASSIDEAPSEAKAAHEQGVPNMTTTTTTTTAAAAAAAAALSGTNFAPEATADKRPSPMLLVAASAGAQLVAAVAILVQILLGLLLFWRLAKATQDTAARAVLPDSDL